jgi:hypothetical protein
MPLHRLVAIVAAGVCILLVAGPPAAAQSVASAAIRGKVVDQTSAGLPGVSVLATSPALIGGQAVATTDSP